MKSFALRRSERFAKQDEKKIKQRLTAALAVSQQLAEALREYAPDAPTRDALDAYDSFLAKEGLK